MVFTVLDLDDRHPPPSLLLPLVTYNRRPDSTFPGTASSAPVTSPLVMSPLRLAFEREDHDKIAVHGGTRAGRLWHQISDKTGELNSP